MQGHASCKFKSVCVFGRPKCWLKEENFKRLLFITWGKYIEEKLTFPQQHNIPLPQLYNKIYERTYKKFFINLTGKFLWYYILVWNYSVINFLLSIYSKLNALNSVVITFHVLGNAFWRKAIVNEVKIFKGRGVFLFYKGKF